MSNGSQTQQKRGKFQVNFHMPTFGYISNDGTSSSSNVPSEEVEEIKRKLDEALFFTNIIKNSQTVQTGPTEALTRLYTGQKIYVDTRDISVAPHIMLEGQWEPGISAVIRKFLREDDIFLDIGANFGYFGLLAATELKKERGGQVHFIEANPDLTQLILKTMIVNGLETWGSVTQVAISDSPGKITLSVLEDFWGSSSLRNFSEIKYPGIDLKLRQAVDVDATTIDAFVQSKSLPKVSAIKLDIEGFEDKAYEGMTETIQNNKDLRVFIEFNTIHYDQPEKLFNQIKRDFEYLYAIPHDTSDILQLKNYNHLIELSKGDWLMLVASNDDLSQ